MRPCRQPCQRPVMRLCRRPCRRLICTLTPHNPPLPRQAELLFHPPPSSSYIIYHSVSPPTSYSLKQKLILPSRIHSHTHFAQLCHCYVILLSSAVFVSPSSLVQFYFTHTYSRLRLLVAIFIEVHLFTSTHVFHFGMLSFSM